MQMNINQRLSNEASIGSWSGVKEALRQGADVNTRDQAQVRIAGDTPLHLACYAPPFGGRAQPQCVAVVRELISHGADIYARNDRGETPLDLATYRHLPQSWDDANDAKPDLYTWEFFQQLRLRQKRITCWILNRHFELLQESDGRLALHKFLREIVYESGPHHDLRVSFGVVKLFTAPRTRPESPVVSCLRSCLERDTEMIRTPDRKGRLPLHIVCRHCPTSDEQIHHRAHLEIVEFLIKHYPQALNTRTPQGDLPLTLAASSSASVDVIYTLLRGFPGAVCSTS